MDDTGIRARTFGISNPDLVRIFVILSLAGSCTAITALAFSRSLDLISFQIFYVPIIYAVYAFPRRGVVVAGFCGVIFEFVGYAFTFPNFGALTAISLQAILFVVVGTVSSYLIGRVRSSDEGYRLLFEHSQLGIVMFDSTTFAIRKTNQKFREMLHYPEEELAGVDFLSLFLTPRERERFLERIKGAAEASDFETRFVTKENDGIWVNMSWVTLQEKTISCTAIDITGRKFAEKANNDTMFKYRQLTEHAPTGILIADQGIVRYANPSFVSFSGYPANSIIGMELSTFIAPEDKTEFASFSAQLDGKKPSPAHAEFRFRTNDGGTRVAGLFVTSITHFGRPAALINIVDNSERQRLTEKIQQDNERRRGIITTVAHELRTPLQPILGYLNLLVQDPEGFGIMPETQKILERCLTSVDRERQIINQMLELSVLESGKLGLSLSTFPLEPLVRSVLDDGEYPAKAEIAIDIPMGCIITADRDRLYGVLDSLVANAVNFSRPPRTIAIACHFFANDGKFELSVRDNGIGIAETALSSIFEPFQLADASKLSRKYDRIGLSLSIAKKIIEMHGGTLTVESSVNAGSTFTISLPEHVTGSP